MIANTAIGELAVWLGPRCWLFRPSLLAMTQLGSPAEIVEKFAALMGGFSRESFGIAVEVLWACSDGDASELTGYTRNYGKWVAGRIPPEDVFLLARSLMIHGVTSNVESDEPTGKGSFTAEFKAADSAALAIAHLGLSEAEAWNLTMTGLVTAMRAKYQDKSKPAPKELAQEADDTMDWLARVNAMRDKGKK